jgi:GNAT superfamily N-acetyltransferase
VDIKELLALYDREQRREIEYPGTEKQVFPHLVRFIRPAPGWSFVLYSDLDETTAGAAIDEQIAYFRDRQQPFDWKVYAHDRPADLAQRLAARGFELEEEDAIMALDMANAPAALLAEPAVDVRRLTDPAQLADVVAVLEPVWDENFNWIYERLSEHMAIPNYLSVFVAYVEGQPACAGWIYYSSPHFAGLWGGSTLAAYRGRGLYTAVLAARVREARARGVPYLTIDAGAMSRPIVERHGFVTITCATGCEFKIEAA